MVLELLRVLFSSNPYEQLLRLHKEIRRRHGPIIRTMDIESYGNDLRFGYEDGATLTIQDVTWKDEPRFNYELVRRDDNGVVSVRGLHCHSQTAAVAQADQFWRLLGEPVR